MNKRLVLFVSMVAALGVSAAANAEEITYGYTANHVAVDLLASKDGIDAGDVTFTAACDDFTVNCDDEDNDNPFHPACRDVDTSDPGTYVAGDFDLQITTDDGYYYTEYHVDIQDDSSNFPQSKKGNPKVGNFAWNYDPEDILVYSDDSGLLNGGGLESPVDVAVHAVVYVPDSCDVAEEAGDYECDGDIETAHDICYLDSYGAAYPTALEACESNFDATGETAWAEGTGFNESKRSWATFVDDLDESEFCTWGVITP